MQRTKAGIFGKEEARWPSMGVSRLTKNQLCTMLDKTLPRDACAPFDLGLTVLLPAATGASTAGVHLLLFVHRVTGLEPGLYFLLRTERHFACLCGARAMWLALCQARIHRAKKRPPLPKAAASLLPLFPDFYAGGVGGVGPDGRALASTSKPQSPSSSRGIMNLRCKFRGRPGKLPLNQDASWPNSPPARGTPGGGRRATTSTLPLKIVAEPAGG